MDRPDLLKFIDNNILIFDGATGTWLQGKDLTIDDFEGQEGCNEVLVRSRPDVIKEMHASFLSVGCHVVETDTFGGNRVVLAEYGMQDQAHELNRRAAALAREVCDEYTTPERPRFVAGSMGPGTKLPSLGQISFDDLLLAYREQAAGLIEGGADLLYIETCQDMLQVRAALLAARLETARADVHVPVGVSLTMETTGTMLVGSELGAALASLAPLGPDILGLNCATGPLEMKQHIRFLSERSPLILAAMPNAGLPENVGGETVYPLSPEEFARWHEEFITEDGARVVGGCCGTTPEHLAALVATVDRVTPRGPRKPRHEPAVSSLYHEVALAQEPKPLLIGERTNANGSRKFRKLLLKDDFEGIVALARGQAKGGAHALDLCTAYVGRDEVRDMTEAVSRLTRQVKLPLVIDSTQIEVMEAALKLSGGRCILNSVNLEDGEERCRQVLSLARDHGAAVVALTIDEEGMARTVDRKLEVAERLIAMATGEFGLQEEDLLLDTLTFTVCSGDETLHDAAIQTLDAIEQLKARHPRVNTLLGLSNISFGLKPKSRHVLNSVFLHMAVERGLDMAIVEARKILPLSRIDDATLGLAEDLLLNRRDGGDPLMAYIKHYEETGGPATASAEEEDSRPLEERIQRKVVDGSKSGLDLLLASALTRHTPLAIINELLIPAMKEVGELFGAGKMQLPFVLQSAEVMKKAVAYLEPMMERKEGSHSGCLVLATVKGDVHDIGKNLVDILLSNNGYKVLNLGIKVPVEEMIRVWQEEEADAIGMSGLLVKSTMVMKENLAELRRRGLNPQVILGGAALTRRFVEDDLREVYGDKVHYGKDAFSGLTLMRQVMDAGGGGEARGEADTDHAKPANIQSALDGKRQQALAFDHAPEGIAPCDPPDAPHMGPLALDLDLNEVFSLINETVLFRGRWQYRRGKLDKDAFQKIIDEEVRPLFERLKAQCLDEQILKPRGVYGYWPCHSNGNELILTDSGGGGSELCRFAFPRQLKAPYHCIADYFRPIEQGGDIIGLLVTTVGEEAPRRIAELFEANRYRDYLHLHGLSVEAADAAAEVLHRFMRRELGIADQDGATAMELARQAYRGSRYSFGYPACPELEDQHKLFSLLDPGRIGVSLTDNAQMVPEQSVSAFVVHHPAAKYFTV